MRRHSTKALSEELTRDRERLLAEALAAQAAAQSRLQRLREEAEAARVKHAEANASSRHLVDSAAAERDRAIADATAEKHRTAEVVRRLRDGDDAVVAEQVRSCKIDFPAVCVCVCVSEGLL